MMLPAEKERSTESERETERQTERETDRQTERRTDGNNYILSDPGPDDQPNP